MQKKFCEEKNVAFAPKSKGQGANVGHNVLFSNSNLQCTHQPRIKITGGGRFSMYEGVFLLNVLLHDLIE